MKNISQNPPSRKYHGFTLVELIVVITILVILGTIAFLQLGGFAGSARDSSRITAISNLKTGLDMFQIKSGTYPLPENPVGITASGVSNIIGYQGFAKEQIGSMAKLSPGGTLDPLDPTIYTTYSINTNRSKIQIMTFLEDGTTGLAFAPNALTATKASASTASDYSKRYPKALGDTLGILLSASSGTLNQPVQESGIGVDIINATGSYTMYMSKDQKFTGTGVALKAGIGGGGLVGYWSLDEGSGTIAYDRSGNGNDGNFTGVTISPSWGQGKNGNGVSFLSNSGADSANGGYIEFGQLKNMFATSQGTPHTIAGWLYIPDVICTDTNACRQWVLLLGTPGTGSHHWLLGGLHGPSQYGVWSGPQINMGYDVGKWMFIAMSYDGKELIGYLNDKKISTNMTWGGTMAFNLKDSSFSIGGKIQESSFNGSIDEVRIYNRALSDSEIQALYNATK